MTPTNHEAHTALNPAFCRFADGLMLTAEDLGVDDVEEEVYCELVKNTLRDLAREHNIEFESCRETGDDTFHFDGDKFQWDVDPDGGEDGETVCVSITCLEDGFDED